MSASGSSGWRRYNIFLSSTFKDMDFERDIIKFRVIPALNRRFRDRRVELQAIDLRLGVNTSDMSEAESERKVLSVCTSCINSARPFFIGLIGKRYGWIPPMERWQEFTSRLSAEEQALLAGTAGCSVTEMEIVYGALSQESFDTSHVLFYLRDDSSYEGLPKDLLPAFCDSDPELLRKLEALKDKVRRLFGALGGEDDRCTPYRLDWRDGHFEGEDFERIVTEQLARQIELETAREEEAGAASWWAQEKELEESTLLRLLPGSVELTADEFEKDNKADEDSSDIAIWYWPGYGASTHMAYRYTSWDGDDSVIRLLAVFGLSEYSNAMRPVLARWIHELALACGREDLPSDEELLGKMPVPELDALFASLVDSVRERKKYVYIYLDDVEALEMTSPKDLYMPWLDRVADRVNILVNLQDESEAREKFLKAHPGLARKYVPFLYEEDAEEIINTYEKTYFLELPAKIRKQMLAVASDRDGFLPPIKVHNVFRLFESLTQEDFARIRGREGSQIDAINGYLEAIWDEMPDSPYDLMTYMVNNIVYNLGLGEQMRQAIWLIAAAPGGLRESDVAHFAGPDWDVVQFYRAMDFLHDFFYEDHARHLWRAKYITRDEDGLRRRQKDISAYLLTLDPKDSLRETMGLYYSLKSGDPRHFPSYLVEGDYLHGQQIKDLLRFYSTQVRQLAREGFFDSPDFEQYSRALTPSARLQLFMDILTGMSDLEEQLNRLVKRMGDWLEDVRIEDLSVMDAFTYASILAMPQDSIPHLELALKAARRCAEEGFETAQQLVSGVSAPLLALYKKKGQQSKARILRMEMDEAEGAQTSLKARYMALIRIIHEARSRRGLFRRKDADLSLLDSFFDKYYAICQDLDSGKESFEAFFMSTQLMMMALDALQEEKAYDRFLEEWVRFEPWMETLYEMDNFFSYKPCVERFLDYNSALFMVLSNMKPSGSGKNLLVQMLDFTSQACFSAVDRLKELDSDHSLIALFMEKRARMPELKMDVPIEEIDKKIVELYNDYCEQ